MNTKNGCIQGLGQLNTPICLRLDISSIFCHLIWKSGGFIVLLQKNGRQALSAETYQ